MTELDPIPSSSDSSGGAPPSSESYSQGSGGGGESGSIYDAFKAMPEFEGKDDLTIAQSLYSAVSGQREARQALSQYQQVLPYAQEYLRNQTEYESWKAQRNAPRQQEQPQEAPKWWSPPTVKDNWKSYLVRDPQTGRDVISPDAPFEAATALRDYQQYTSDFARRLVTDPENTLKPFIESIATQQAQAMVNQHLGQHVAQMEARGQFLQQASYVSNLEQQNADWLYSAPGVVSTEGQIIQQYIANASAMGIQNPQSRWEYATGMLHRDLLEMRRSQGAQQQQAYQQRQQYNPQYAPDRRVAEGNMEFLRQRATRNPNRSAGTTEPRAPRQRMTFEERLSGQLNHDGVS